MCKFVSMLGCDRVCKSSDKILRNGLGKEEERDIEIIDKILIDRLKRLESGGSSYFSLNKVIIRKR